MRGFRICTGLWIVFFLAPGDAVAQRPAGPEGKVSGYVNSQLPAWLRLSGEERVRLEGLGGLGFLPATNAYLLHRLRLNLEVTPARGSNSPSRRRIRGFSSPTSRPRRPRRRIPWTCVSATSRLAIRKRARSACGPGARVLLSAKGG